MKKILRFAAVGLALTTAGLAAGARAQRPDNDPVFRQFMQDRNAGHKQAAIADLQRGAAQGDYNAMGQLGEEYRGTDIELAGALPVDYAKAFALTKAAADHGSARAMTDLGISYMRGQGVAKDDATALKYFTEATAAGDSKAPRYAGMLYEFYTTPPDYQKADEFYQKAADKGDITGSCLLGSLYERGLGVPQSYARAQALYLKAAARGDEIASGGMTALGNMYETRTDGNKNLQTAISWYRKAADQNNPIAKAELAQLTGGNATLPAAGRNLCLLPFQK